MRQAHRFHEPPVDEFDDVFELRLEAVHEHDGGNVRADRKRLFVRNLNSAPSATSAAPWAFGPAPQAECIRTRGTASLSRTCPLRGLVARRPQAAQLPFEGNWGLKIAYRICSDVQYR